MYCSVFSLNYYKRLWSWRNLSNQWHGTRHNKRAEETLNSDYLRQYAFVAQKSMRLSSIGVALDYWRCWEWNQGCRCYPVPMSISSRRRRLHCQARLNLTRNCIRAPLPTLFPWSCLRQERRSSRDWLQCCLKRLNSSEIITSLCRTRDGTALEREVNYSR